MNFSHTDAEEIVLTADGIKGLACVLISVCVTKY